MLIRLFLAFILIAGLVFVIFVAFKGSQPMQQGGADGMTCRQFLRERIEAGGSSNARLAAARTLW